MATFGAFVLIPTYNKKIDHKFRPKVTTNEDKEGFRVIKGLGICIGDADTATSNRLRVCSAMVSYCRAIFPDLWGAASQNAKWLYRTKIGSDEAHTIELS